MAVSSVFLTKLFASGTLRDTELAVAGRQLLLSYRDTQCYNNRSAALRGLTPPGRGQGL